LAARGACAAGGDAVIGFMNSGFVQPSIQAAFHGGLNEIGYVEGRNVTVDYRYAEGHYDRLPALVADLIRRQVAVLGAFGGVHTAIAAKAAIHPHRVC
jgi:putative ABC transport system substrate-binding protein